MHALLVPAFPGDAPALPPRLRVLATGHVRKLASFSGIGATIFVGGLALQAFLVQVLRIPAFPAYVVQGFLSVEANFLANWRWTWGDRNAPFWRSAWRFNAQRAVMVAVNFACYLGLVHLGVNYLLANVALTALFTPANYALGHAWSFAARRAQAVPPGLSLNEPLRRRLPTVSVVIPCKNNPGTIRATVDSLLGQDYPALIEVILVGSVGDTTWVPLSDVIDPRLVILEQETVSGKRDPNAKRDTGIQKAQGQLIALADSDIVMEPGWLTRAVLLLLGAQVDCVAGGMRSIHDSFWGRFVDSNRLAAKTPRVTAPYMVTAKNFGRRGQKPPITANTVFTRAMYDRCGLDASWTYGYEDYEWFWRVVRDGERVLYSDRLTGDHHHRRSFGALITEYRRAGDGCAKFANVHPDCPLARKRMLQAALVPLVCAGILVTAGVATATGRPLVAFGGLAVPLAAGTGMEVLRSRRVEALAYPFISAALATAFTVGMIESFTEHTREILQVPGRHAKAAGRPAALALTGSVIAAGILVRLWQLAAKPEWQMDEVTYTAIGRNVDLHGTLNLPIAYGQPWTPFLFHPPFYFLLLGRWFALTGPSVYHARILGVLTIGLMYCLLARLLWKLHGPSAALVAMPLIVFDGWLLYVQRVSYMENALMVIIVGLFLAYHRALERETWTWFLIAGFLAGCSVTFKHTGAYVLLAVGINWTIIRRNHLKHLALGGVAIAVTGIYVLAMVHLFDFNGHEWYTTQTLTQIRRTLGLQSSGGSLTSPIAFLHLASHQYAMFTPSILIIAAGVTLLVVTLVRCLRSRSFAALGHDTLLPAWALAGLLVFGSSSLKYSQYFALVLIPLYCFLWTRCSEALRSRSRWVLTAGMAVVIAAGLISLGLRLSAFEPNAYEQAGQYVATHVPRNDVVIAETPIDYEIPQKWCSPNGWRINLPCLRQARWIATWQTYLQSSNPNRYGQLSDLLHKSVPVRKFRTFNGTVTIWKVK